MSMVIVGELNPYGADPYFALYHLPRNASGNRLREILGLPDHLYAQIAKVNLCTGKWSLPAARTAVAEICRAHDLIVCLGAKVRQAFGAPEFFGAERHGMKTLVTLPHPSGLNRMWDEPGARERAAAGQARRGSTAQRSGGPHVPRGRRWAALEETPQAQPARQSRDAMKSARDIAHEALRYIAEEGGGALPGDEPCGLDGGHGYKCNQITHAIEADRAARPESLRPGLEAAAKIARRYAGSTTNERRTMALFLADVFEGWKPAALDETEPRKDRP